MSSLLTEALPTTVVIHGLDVPIDTDFRKCIRFEQLLNDRSIDDTVRTNTAIEMFYGSLMVPDRVAAINGILWFYSCGKFDPDAPSKPQSKRARKIYDYDEDSRLIYAAFLDQYGVDLQDVETLHWWKFCAMQTGLKADAEFTQVVSYRAMDLRKIKNKELRARYAKLQSIYALPDNRTHEEKVAAAAAAFGGG
jgi:hypothetical protein